MLVEARRRRRDIKISRHGAEPAQALRASQAAVQGKDKHQQRMSSQLDAKIFSISGWSGLLHGCCELKRKKKAKEKVLVPGTPGTVPIHYPVGGVLSVASRAASHGSVASEAVSGRCRLEQLRRKASPLAGLELGSVSGRKLCRWRRFQSTPDISLLGNWHQNIRWSLPLGKMTLCSDCFVVRAKKICFSN